MPVGAQLSGIAARWRAAKRLYPIYAALATQYNLGDPPFHSLEKLEERSEPEALQQLGRWFSDMDQRIQVHQFRVVLQTSGILSSEEKLQALIERHLGKADHTATDRDKLDFLLVQYFVVCAPPSFHEREVTMRDVAEVLEPVLGEASLTAPSLLTPLDELISAAQSCRGLRELQEAKVIERGRHIKNEAVSVYFTPASLVALTRFNYMMRRTFFRLTAMDVQAIEKGVSELEARGVATVDCSAAQMSAKEPLATLRQICRDWKKPSFSDYGADFSLARVMRLRFVVENAVQTTTPAPAPAPAALADRTAALEDKLQGILEELAALRGLTAEILAEMRAAVPKLRVEPILSSPQKGVAVEMQPATAIETPEPSVEESVPEPVSFIAEEDESGEEESGPQSDAEEADPAPAPDLPAAMSHIRDHLLSDGPRRSSGPSSIAVGSTTLLLNPDEANSFLEQPEGAAAWLQRSVATRVLLVEALELQRHAGQNPQLPCVIQVAKDEADQMQMALATSQLDPESAQAMVASLRQLRAIIQQAER